MKRNSKSVDYGYGVLYKEEAGAKESVCLGPFNVLVRLGSRFCYYHWLDNINNLLPVHHELLWQIESGY
jgi:hypothetical protein